MERKNIIEIGQKMTYKKIYEISERKIFEVLDKYNRYKNHMYQKQLLKLEIKGLKIGSTTGYTSDMMKIVTDRAKQQGYTPDFLDQS